MWIGCTNRVWCECSISVFASSLIWHQNNLWSFLSSQINWKSFSTLAYYDLNSIRLILFFPFFAEKNVCVSMQAHPHLPLLAFVLHYLFIMLEITTRFVFIVDYFHGICVSGSSPNLVAHCAIAWASPLWLIWVGWGPPHPVRFSNRFKKKNVR